MTISFFMEHFECATTPTSEKLEEEFVCLYPADLDILSSYGIGGGLEVEQSEEEISLHLDTLSQSKIHSAN